MAARVFRRIPVGHWRRQSVHKKDGERKASAFSDTNPHLDLSPQNMGKMLHAHSGLQYTNSSELTSLTLITSYTELVESNVH